MMGTTSLCLIGSYLCFFFVFLTKPVLAQVELTDSTVRISSSLKAEFLEDTSRILTLRDVLKQPYTRRFRSVDQQAPNFGFKTSPFWMRFRVRNSSHDLQRQWAFEQAFQGIGYIDFYLIDQEGVIIHKRGGDLLGGNSHEIAGASYSFILPVKANQEAIVYVRMWPYSGQAFFPTYVWELKSFEKHNQLSIILWGGYYGLLLAAFLYHILLWSFTKQKGYIYLSCYLAVYFFYEISRGFSFAQQYIWPNNEWLIINGLGTLFTLMIITCVLFYTYAFNYISLFPFAKGILIGLLIFVGCLRLTTLINPDISQNLISICQFLPSSVFLMITAFASLKQKLFHTRLYFYSLLCIIGGGFLFTLNRTGVIPGDDFFVHYTLNIGSILEIIFMSFGVAFAMQTEQEGRKRSDQKAKTAFTEGKAEEHGLVSMMLHHEVGNNLITMQKSIDQLLSHPTTPVDIDDIKSLQSILGETYTLVRDWSYYITPEILMEKGLSSALTNMTNRLNQNQAVSFLLLLSGKEDSLPINLQFEMYYICLELANNTLKHAHASEASIRFFFKNRALNAEFRDDGVGFTTQNAEYSEGGGWLLIKKRLERIYGIYSIEPLPEKGTKILIQLSCLD